jgi:vitamin B12 transporter
MKYKLCVLACITAICGAQHGNAQTSPGANLDSVIIRDNRLQVPLRWQNRNIGVLDREAIAQLPVKSVNELLSYVAGVDIRQRGPSGAQADVSIDGSTFDQVLVLINGVKISDPQTGHNMMNLALPVGAIDHIEVLRGPAARVYGVNALAGAINIVTRQPAGNEIFAQAYAGSSFQQDTASGDTYYNWGAQATATFGDKKQSHLLSLTHDRGNGYRYNTAYEAYRVFYQNHFTINEKNRVDAMGAYTTNSFGASHFYAAPIDIESTEEVQTALGSVAYTWRPNDRVRITPRLSYRYGKDDYIFIRQNPSAYHNIHETNVVTGEVQSAIRLGKGTLGAGAEWRHEGINSSNLGKHDRDNMGVYAEYRYEFSKKLNASAGLYANYNSDFDWQVFPGADIGYQFLPRWKVFVSGNTGQRLPTYTDLYYAGPANIGNSQLRTEFAGYGEGGLRYHKSWVLAQGSYFYRHVSDFIDWVRLTSADPWQPQNFQSINTSGFTLQGTYQADRHLGLPDAYSVGLNLNYTYIDQQVQVPMGKISQYAIQALRHQFTARLNGLLFHKIELNLAGRYLYRISGNDYTVLDARVGYRLKQILFYADVNNILDMQYKETGAIPMPGRWFTFGVRFQGKY